MDDNQKHGMSKPKPLTDAISLSLKTKINVTKDAKKLESHQDGFLHMPIFVESLPELFPLIFVGLPRNFPEKAKFYHKINKNRHQFDI